MCAVIMINFLGYAYGTGGAEDIIYRFNSLSVMNVVHFAYLIMILASAAHIGFEFERCGWTRTPPNKPKAKFTKKEFAFIISAVIPGLLFSYALWNTELFTMVFGNNQI